MLGSWNGCMNENTFEMLFFFLNNSNGQRDKILQTTALTNATSEVCKQLQTEAAGTVLIEVKSAWWPLIFTYHHNSDKWKSNALNTNDARQWKMFIAWPANNHGKLRLIQTLEVHYLFKVWHSVKDTSTTTSNNHNMNGAIKPLLHACLANIPAVRS